jgi:signal transduction histidine kinase
VHFKLWKHVLLSLLLPGVFALGITLYAIYNVDKISHRVTLIEVADDINLNLLELRRYEKNILLLYEESNVRTFYQYLAQIEERTNARKGEILAVLSPLEYDALFDAYRAYRDAAVGIIRGVELKKKLLEDIRPLGRAVEQAARSREQALELRRYEKNYIIYGEPLAIAEQHRIARAMLAGQPGIEGPLGKYLAVVEDVIENQAIKDAYVAKIREAGRQIGTITTKFSAREREGIKQTINASKTLFIGSFVLLLSSIGAVALLLTRNVLGSLKAVEHSFNYLADGDFSHDVEVSATNLPDEVLSFIRAYNRTVHRLGAVQGELRLTLNKLAEANQELEERQDELVEARKTSAMRLLASEIAHEINNPLSSVAVFLGTFYEDLGSDDAGKANVAIMLNEVRRCQTVLRELVDFARREPLSLKEVQPARLVKEAIDAVTAHHRKEGVGLTVALAGLPEKALLDPVLIYQALVNILANAFQFSPPGGTIDVRGAGDGESFTLTITDRGVGIPPENLAHVFRPFFTTRKELGGSGLGLAITKKIVERHHGRIQVASTPGVETVFTLVLPVSQENHDDQGPRG